MSLTPDTVIHAAHLAQLDVDPQEAQTLQGELNKILDFVATLQSVDTSETQPLAHALEMTQPLRTDKITESNQRSEMQAIAPETQNGLYLVPTVIDSPQDN